LKKLECALERKVDYQKAIKLTVMMLEASARLSDWPRHHYALI